MNGRIGITVDITYHLLRGDLPIFLDVPEAEGAI